MQKRAFSLIELVLVLAILAVVTAIAVPRVSTASNHANTTAFITTLNHFARAMDLYHAEHGDWPSDGNTGNPPSELLPYVDANTWQRPTPLGGDWDSETRDVGSVTAAIGVHFGGDSPDLLALRTIDYRLDDGDLNTGRFRRFGARFYLILDAGTVDVTASRGAIGNFVDRAREAAELDSGG
ncbi:type II secretion system protein [Mucisphaera sp.]|uniref:type II secretion system protein n=1 Tax=Mucisphaera sp. TaxID=2913024 RepID=UPI003D13162D